MRKSRVFSDISIDTSLIHLNSYPLERAIKWILHSGIQNKYGGFYAWYNCEKERYSFLYPEITGYAIRLLIHLYEVTGLEIFLKKAILAGDWLLQIQRSNGAFYCKYFKWNHFQTSEHCDRSQYSFDAGIILTSFLDLFEHTLNIKYLHASEKIAEWIIGLQNTDYSIEAGFHSDYGIINESHWSRTSGCHHIKNVISLLNIYDIIQDEKYFIAANNLLKWGNKLQLKTGRFLISNKIEETYAHAHCYAIEGLLKASEYFKDTSIQNSIIKGARWLSKVQNNDGSILNWHHSKKEKMKVSDATAQAVRIWIILKEEGIKEFSINIKKGLDYLKKMQCINYNQCLNGGIYYGKYEDKNVKHINTCSTMFFIQSLMFFVLTPAKSNPSLIDLLF